MNIIYTLSIIALTLILNATVTWSMPYVKQRWNAFITSIKRKSNTSKQVDCVTLEARVSELEKQYKQRQINFKSRVREEVIEYLEQLKNK